MTDRREVTAKLTEAAIHYLVKQRQAVFREMGLVKRGRLRADLLSLDLRGNLTVVEVKSCWRDFHLDTKIAKYRDHCDWLYVCVAHKLYAADYGRVIENWCRENGAGIMVLDPKSGYVGIRLRARAQMKMNQESRFALITRLAWRAADANKRLVRRRRRIYL